MGLVRGLIQPPNPGADESKTCANCGVSTDQEASENREQRQEKGPLSRVSGLEPEPDPIDMLDNTRYIVAGVYYLVLLSCF